MKYAPVLSHEQAEALRRIIDNYNAAWELCATYTRGGWSSATPAQLAQIAELVDSAVPTNDDRSALEVYDFYNGYAPDRIGYLSSDGKTLTTFTGDTLAHVTWSSVAHLSGFYGVEYRRTYFRARDALGRVWYGNGLGRGMFARMHLTKKHRKVAP